MIITRTHFENEANGNLRMVFWTTGIIHNVVYVLIKKKKKIKTFFHMMPGLVVGHTLKRG